jgi:hypothetical protein
MNVNENVDPYTRSDVYNERMSEIRAKLIKHKVKQQIIKRVQ